MSPSKYTLGIFNGPFEPVWIGAVHKCWVEAGARVVFLTTDHAKIKRRYKDGVKYFVFVGPHVTHRFQGIISKAKDFTIIAVLPNGEQLQAEPTAPGLK